MVHEGQASYKRAELAMEIYPKYKNPCRTPFSPIGLERVLIPSINLHNRPWCSQQHATYQWLACNLISTSLTNISTVQRDTGVEWLPALWNTWRIVHQRCERTNLLVNPQLHGNVH